MAALGAQTIASSYEQLLHVDTDGGGNTTTLVPIKDGDNGTTFCLQIATTSALIEGSGSRLYFSDAGGEYLSGDGTTLTITAGGASSVKLDANSRISLSNNDSGTSNTIFGKSAGASLDAGSNYNTFIGEAVSDASMNDAINNTAVGYNSLGALTSGDYNVAIGDHALLSNQSGELNTAVGTHALRVNTASQNTALGGNAMYANVGGENNVAVGHNALDANISGDLNVAVGKDALGAFIGSASVAVGREALRDLNHATTGDGTVAIGTGAGASLTSGNGNVAIGYQALDLDDLGKFSTAVGYQALTDQSNAGDSGDEDAGNTAVGFKAGFDVSTGYYNTVVGRTAGFAITTGAGNTVIGAETGKALLGGDDNTIIGRGAGIATTAGTNMVIIGKGASSGVITTAAAGHISIGYEALKDTTSGARNTGVGYRSGKEITSSNDMTCIGYEAGMDASSTGSTPSGCTYIGSRAGENKDDGTKNTAVGHYALQGTAANGQTANNNVAIGETAGAGVTTGDNNVFIGQAAGYVTQITADSDGCIIIGAGARQSGTAVDNEIIFGNDAAGQGTNTVLLGNGSVDGTNGLFCADTGIATPSDKRIKDNIKDNSTGLDYINKLRTVTYQKRHPADYPEELQGAFGDAKKPKDWVAKTEVGLISQEVKAVMDEMELDIQGHHTNPQGLQTVKYVSFIIPLVKAVQELSEQVEDLKKQINK